LDALLDAASAEQARGDVVGKLLVAAAAGLTSAILVGWGREPGAGRAALVAALASLDLAAVSHGGNHVAPAALLTSRPPVLKGLPPHAEHVRVQVMTQGLPWLREHLRRGPAGWGLEERWALGHQELLAPPVGCRWRLDGAFDGDFTGLMPR